MTQEELLKLFEENYSNIEPIISSGVFNVRNGSVVLHFNNEGDLMEIVVNRKLFKRQKLT